MIGISTHILDSMRGRPAAGIRVRLEKKTASGLWTGVGSGVTDDDGRCRDLLATALEAVTYRITFETAGYFDSQGITGLYPEVTITFQVTEAERHYHIPLLLSPNSYTTYRGT